MVAFEDITSQKMKETELQASQNNLQIIFDNTPYAMLVITGRCFLYRQMQLLCTFLGQHLKIFFNGKTSRNIVSSISKRWNII